MDRLSNDGARHLNIEQPDQPPGNPLPSQIQGQQPVPVMRQRQTGRDDDEEEEVKSTRQPQDSSPLSQHSKPETKSRSNANQKPLQLDPIDQERFVYTRKHFDEALEKGDVKDLVRMLRHGTVQQSDTWKLSDGTSIAKKLFRSNKPELLAELICEKKLFLDGFVKTYKENLSNKNFYKYMAFVESMNDRRVLPKDFKDIFLSRALRNSVKDGIPDHIQMVMQLEADVLGNNGHSGYAKAIKIAVRNNKDLCEILIENIFNTESRVKPDIKTSDCTFALGIALALSRPDWVICLQDEILRRESQGVSDNSSAESSDDSIDQILGIELHEFQANHPMRKLRNLIMMVSPENFSKNKRGYRSTLILYGDQSKSRDFLAIQKLRQLLVEECIRPSVAKGLAETGMQCYAAFVNYIDESDDEDMSEEIHPIVLESLFASQLKSLSIEDTDELGAAQISALQKMGGDYVKNLLGSVPALIDQCFDLMNSSFELNSGMLVKNLTKMYGFPNSLAKFLAQAMSEAVTLQANKPGLQIPEGQSALQVLGGLRRVVISHACKAFKKDFGVLIKKQKLITLFNEDAKGREDLWHNYFYAYLDVLKEGLLSAKTDN
jgi:hypothetical protein